MDSEVLHDSGSFQYVLPVVRFSFQISIQFQKKQKSCGFVPDRREGDDVRGLQAAVLLPAHDPEHDRAQEVLGVEGREVMCRKYFLLFSVFFFFLVAASLSGEESLSPKRQAIAWSLELEQLLKTIDSRIKNSASQSETSASQISDEMTKDEQHTQESETIYEEQEKTSEEQVQTSSELSSLFEEYETSLKASRSEAEFWKWSAIVIFTTWAVREITHAMGLW